MKAPITILIATPLYPPEIGGPATYTIFLEKYLPKDEFALRVVHFGAVKHIPYVVRHFVYFWKVFTLAKDADIVYALDPLGVGIPAGLAAKLRGKRFFMRVAGDRAWETASQKYGITESLDTFSSSSKYSFGIRMVKRGQKFGASLAEKIIVPSGYLKCVLSNWGIDPEKIKVIYNAFEPPVISETKEEIRKKFDLSGTVLFTAGRLVPWKGFEMLIRIMPEIRKEFADAMLYIAGDGPEKQKLLLLIKELALGEQVVMLGNIAKEELLRRTKAAYVFLLNTFYEGLSHQLLEVMAIGTPVVTTSVGGNPELIENKKDGLLVKYNEPEQLLKSLRGILHRESEFADLIPNAKEKITHFNTEKAISSFVQELNIRS